jgi:hypothetical protein
MSGNDELAGRNSRIESQSRDVRADPDLIKEGRLYFLGDSGERATKFLAAVNEAARCSVYIPSVTRPYLDLGLDRLDPQSLSKRLFDDPDTTDPNTRRKSNHPQRPGAMSPTVR